MPTGHLVALTSALALLLSPSIAEADTNGGTSAPETPRISAVACVANATVACPADGRLARGANLRITGAELHETSRLVFAGRRGRRDNVVVRPTHRGQRHVEAPVPAGARSGRILVVRSGVRPAVARVQVATMRKTANVEPLDGTGFVFPIRGAHDLGQTARNNFAGGSGHQGQDMMSPCGTPVVAARGGTVKTVDFHARAGHYVVISDPESSQDYVYMHLAKPPLVRDGERVAAGQRLGEVGSSGNADGCLLHFELWSSPGWYSGGAPLDPLPQLRAWDRAT